MYALAFEKWETGCVEDDESGDAFGMTNREIESNGSTPVMQHQRQSMPGRQLVDKFFEVGRAARPRASVRSASRK